jgi:hypothetical protein
MPLDDKQKKQLQDFIELKIPGFAHCQLCGSKMWSLSDTVWELKEFKRGTLVIGGPIYPVISITCRNCGFTHFLNAIVIGITQQEQEGKKNE